MHKLDKRFNPLYSSESTAPESNQTRSLNFIPSETISDTETAVINLDLPSHTGGGSNGVMENLQPLLIELVAAHADDLTVLRAIGSFTYTLFDLAALHFPNLFPELSMDTSMEETLNELDAEIKEFPTENETERQILECTLQWVKDEIRLKGEEGFRTVHRYLVGVHLAVAERTIKNPDLSSNVRRFLEGTPAPLER